MARFEMSRAREVLETRLIQHFKERKDDLDAFIPYSELSAIAGGDVSLDNNTSSKLRAAMNAASEALGFELGRDPERKAVVRIKPNEYVGHAVSLSDAVKRKARKVARATKRMYRHDGVKPEERYQLAAIIAGNVAVAELLDPNKRRRMASDIQLSTKALPDVSELL